MAAANAHTKCAYADPEDRQTKGHTNKSTGDDQQMSPQQVLLHSLRKQLLTSSSKQNRSTVPRLGTAIGTK